jgi:ubiquinone/menaquinone biosynthesis C-methylase UbiE
MNRLALLVSGLLMLATGAEAGQPRPKKYKGRVIAPVMSYEGADWLVRQDREQTEQPDRVLDALKIAPGSTVADIGAGVGYFTLRMAQRVGPKGRVLATDVQPQMLQLLGENLKQAGLNHVERIQCTEKDAKLPPAAVDLVLMVDVYHELSYPEETVLQVRRSLREGGRLVLVEYRAEDPTVPIRPEHKMTLAQVRREIEPLGFRVAALHEFLVHQHVIEFVRDDGPAPAAKDSQREAPFPAVRTVGTYIPTAEQWREAGFAPLFNGKDLDGWQGDTAVWSVRAGRIAATPRAARGGMHYLTTTETFDDFELDVVWRMAKQDGNSGIQVRGSPRPNGLLAGYEIEIAALQHAGVNEQLGRGSLHQAGDLPRWLVLPGDWNRYTVRCHGPRLSVAVNGVVTAELDDPAGAERGVVALQHHLGPVEFQSVWVRRLPRASRGTRD